MSLNMRWIKDLKTYKRANLQDIMFTDIVDDMKLVQDFNGKGVADKLCQRVASAELGAEWFMKPTVP